MGIKNPLIFFCYLLFFCGTYLKGYAQGKNKNIKGFILDKQDKKGIGGVICQAVDAEGQSLLYRISETDGRFSIPQKKAIKTLIFSIIGYKSIKVKVSELSDNLKILLEKDIIILKEVVVKVPPIRKRSDTIDYNPSAFQEKQDRYLADILKKLPGIEVKEDGRIYYQGKSINKFYIEGVDLLGGQYNQASNNLPVEAVDKIQVLENNQHIKMLKGVVHSEQAGLNIKLKKNYIGKPFGEMEAGLGASPLLYKGKLFAMQITGKVQTLLNFKTNNIGENISEELKEHLDMHNLFSFTPLPKNFVDNSLLQKIPFALNRYLFNRTYLGSINNIVKLSENTTIKSNISYMNDRVSQDIFSTYTYGLGENPIGIKENLGQVNQPMDFLAAIRLEHNASRVFLNNELKTVGSWNKGAHSNVLNNQYFFSEHKNRPLYLQNSLSLVLKHRKMIYNFNSFIRYLDLQENLNVADDNGQEVLSEHIAGKHIVAKNKFGTSFWLGKNLLDIALHFDYFSHSIKNATPFNAIPTDFFQNHNISNNVKTEQGALGITPEYQIKYLDAKGVITFSLPTVYYRIHIHNKSVTEPSNGHLAFMPNVALRHTFNHLLDWKTSFRYTWNYGDVESLLDGYLFRNYRSLFIPTVILEKRSHYNFSTTLQYHDLVEMFFFHILATYMIQSTNVLGSGFYSPRWTYHSMEEKYNPSNHLNLNLKMDKTFTAIKLSSTLLVNYSKTGSNVLQQDKLFRNNSHSIAVLFKHHFRLYSFFSVFYSVNGSTSWQDNSIHQKVFLKNMDQKMSLFFFPINKLELSASGEHYIMEVAKNQYRTNFFINILGKYSLKRLEFEGSISNLFNNNAYSFSNFSGINFFNQTIPIRPRQFIVSVKFKF